MCSPNTFDVQEAADRCLALIAQMPEGERATTAWLVEEAYGGEVPDDADLFEIDDNIFERVHEIGIELDSSAHIGTRRGLPFNLEFEIRRI